jgi:hypothetical protein
MNATGSWFRLPQGRKECDIPLASARRGDQLHARASFEGEVSSQIPVPEESRISIHRAVKVIFSSSAITRMRPSHGLPPVRDNSLAPRGISDALES